MEAEVEHLVEVRKRHFETYQETAKLRPGETRQIAAPLLRQGSGVALGVLVVRVNGPARVFLDGKHLGQAPLPPLPLVASSRISSASSARTAARRGEQVVLRQGAAAGALHLAAEAERSLSSQRPGAEVGRGR